MFVYQPCITVHQTLPVPVKPCSCSRHEAMHVFAAASLIAGYVYVTACKTHTTGRRIGLTRTCAASHRATDVNTLRSAPPSEGMWALRQCDTQSQAPTGLCRRANKERNGTEQHALCMCRPHAAGGELALRLMPREAQTGTQNPNIALALQNWDHTTSHHLQHSYAIWRLNCWACERSPAGLCAPLPCRPGFMQ